MVNRTTIKVRGYHLDMFRHVNNARYIEFLEEGRWAFFEETPNFMEWPKGSAFVVVNINISYRQSASIGDTLEIRTCISHLGAKSGALRQKIILQGTDTVVAEADVTFAMVDRNTQKALPFEGDLLNFFETLRDAETPPPSVSD
ncbi:acyl-CoA thioesterase [Desulfobacter curvatus]|uniref:acyl-CoA thioesterase n=1 Tax=Desulfobacter curvatus TaxID=2290 RepID=UPI00036AB3DC|nr:thioesterase family protein [Desulfobacter curvatus]